MILVYTGPFRYECIQIGKTESGKGISIWFFPTEESNFLSGEVRMTINFDLVAGTEVEVDYIAVNTLFCFQMALLLGAHFL